MTLTTGDVAGFDFDLLYIAVYSTRADVAFYTFKRRAMFWKGPLRRFPYNTIKHPMIVGNIIALLGFYALPEILAAAPYLLPMHIAFYLLHLLQERATSPQNSAAPSR